MTIGKAIEAVKNGKRVARHCWNGQYLTLAPWVSFVGLKDKIINETFLETYGVRLGLLESQADLLSDDWYIVE